MEVLIMMSEASVRGKRAAGQLVLGAILVVLVSLGMLLYNLKWVYSSFPRERGRGGEGEAGAARNGKKRRLGMTSRSTSPGSNGTRSYLVNEAAAARGIKACKS
jgi:hypothetical protein